MASSKTRPVTDLDEMVRELVRDELVKAGLVKARRGDARRRPTWVDLVMLSIVAADCTQLLVLIPSLNNSAVETFLKVVQWTGATVFVAAATWFQEQFLTFTRRLAFRVVVLVTFLVLLPQKVPLVPIIVPRASEPVIELTFDADPITESAGGRRMVSMASHTLSLTVPRGCGLQEQPKLTLKWTELASAVRRQHVVPVYYRVAVSLPDTDGKDTQLRILRRDSSLTEEDVNVVRASRVKAKLTSPENVSSNQLVLHHNSQVGASQMELPNGDYELTLTTTDGNKCVGRKTGKLSDLLDTSCVIEFSPEQCGST
jgi:hypothetical protein